MSDDTHAGEERERERARRERRRPDLHLLDEDGRVACNPRDREAAHRAEMEGIATEDRDAVTCKKCKAMPGKNRNPE